MKTIEKKGFLTSLDAMGRSVPVKAPAGCEIVNEINGFAHNPYGTALKKILLVLCVVFLWLAVQHRAIANVSQQEYFLTGEMTFTFFREAKEVHTEKLRCNIFRSGDDVKIITSLSGSNFPVSVFVGKKNGAITYVQYGAAHEPTSSDANELKAWNKASVWVSSYQMPKYMIGKLTPLWLMADGKRGYAERQSDWVTVFGDGASFNFYDQPKTKPEISIENFWPAGFSSYFETIVITNTVDPGKNLVQESFFKITEWTNYSSTQFPRSFRASVKRIIKGNLPTAEMRYEFTTTTIEEVPHPFETEPPLFSQVTDMRLKEQNMLASGVSYRSSNGLIYSDPVKENREHGIGLVMAKGSGQDAPPS